MKQSLLALLGLIVCLGVNAQTDTTKPQSADTIKIGNMVIIKKNDGKEKKEESKDDKNDDGTTVEIKKRKDYKKSNVSTNWLIVDLGFSNVNDQTNYATPNPTFFPGGNLTKDQMSLRNGRSINVNVWFFMQRVNIIQHVVNLKYGLGVEMNNYSFEKSVRYNTEPTTNITIDNIKYRKNKLAADYLTVPVMLDFNFAPKRKRGYGFSAGVSAGYLYAARQKMKSEQNGKEKVRSDFNLEPWKLSAVGELNLGAVRLYGSYALNDLHKNGLQQTPYNIGIRLSSW